MRIGEVHDSAGSHHSSSLPSSCHAWSRMPWLVARSLLRPAVSSPVSGAGAHVPSSDRSQPIGGPPVPSGPRSSPTTRSPACVWTPSTSETRGAGGNDGSLVQVTPSGLFQTAARRRSSTPTEPTPTNPSRPTTARMRLAPSKAGWSEPATRTDRYPTRTSPAAPAGRRPRRMCFPREESSPRGPGDGRMNHRLRATSPTPSARRLLRSRRGSRRSRFDSRSRHR